MVVSNAFGCFLIHIDPVTYIFSTNVAKLVTNKSVDILEYVMFSVNGIYHISFQSKVSNMKLK